MMGIIALQSAWRSYRCRKIVNVFSQLPQDLWERVLWFVRKPTFAHCTVDRIVNVRAVTLYWSPPRSRMLEKLHTLRMVRTYLASLSEDTLYNALCLSLKMLRYTDTESTKLLINATLERLCDLFHKCHRCVP